MSLTVVAKKDVEEFMKKCGVSVDKESLDIFFKQIEGKTVVDAIKDGEKMLPKMPSGGGAAKPAAAGGAAAPAEKEEPEKKDEPEDVDMGGLFGDDDDEY
jgi:ribosomal protein L12E/L44/L45/RPP1/RPP2